jgi:gamma-glutamyltranspeptidase/glutathione hydrolase
MSTIGLGDDQPKAYTSSAVSEAQRTGVAVADEPLAARAGAQALASQGNAVDAVSTIYFAMVATYPVAAGLGSGGICMVRDTSGRVTEFDFLTRAPALGGAYAVPGAVRGIADMQKAFGALPWQRVVAPGEAYAATGFPISQALATRLAASQNVVRLDAGLAAEFLDESGAPRAAGTETKNVALSTVISAIRMNGADAFYKGAIAQRIAAYANGQGGKISEADMAAVTTKQTAPRQRNAGGLTVYGPGAGTGAGAFTSSVFDNMARQRTLGGASIATAVSQSLASFGVAALPRDLGSTGFAAVDASGQAAACAITLNGPFGSGRTAGDTGVQLAATPTGNAGLASAFLAPMIATSGDGVMTATGAGGPNGTAAAVYALLEAAGGRQLGKRGDLRGTGNAPYDTVNVISCDSEACVALSDPGAHGLGAVAQTAVPTN